MGVTEVTYSVYSSQFDEMNTQLIHISAQMDILNHSVYVSNVQLQFVGVVAALIGSLAMFYIGKLVSSR